MNILSRISLENKSVHKVNQKRKTILAFVVTAAALLAAFYISVLAGGIEVTPAELFRGLFIEYDRNVAIIYQLRFPRIFVAAIGGAMMADSGVLMQAVMRNPLAEPGIIGISSGAAFVAALTIGIFPALSLFTPLFAFIGGMIAFALVYTLAWNGHMSPVRLILVGVAVNALFTGLSSAYSDMTGGSYSGVTSIITANISLKDWSDVKLIAVYAVIGIALSMLAVKHCNLLSLSDETALSLGVNVGRARLLTALLSVMLASIFTAIIGAVSFLGLIVPHLGRLLVGSDHKVLMPYSALLGALIFLAADTAGRLIAYPYEISPATVMSVVGGPVFIILLKRSRTAYGK